MANTRLDLEDFSGGIEESRTPEEFDRGQWATLRGFVLESQSRVRSQWAVQQVGSMAGWQAVRGLLASDGAYLVAVAGDGSVWWTKAPSRTAAYGTVNTGASWTRLDSNPNTNYRFVCEVPLPMTGAGRANGLLLHSRGGNRAAPALVVHETAPGVLGAKAYTDFYPAAPADANGVPVPASGKMPRANVGTMWNDRLILGDIDYLEDPKATALSGSTVVRYPSSIWYSENRIDTYDPLSVLNIGSAETQIVGLHLLDNALVVLTSASTDRDGAVLVRGELATLKDGAKTANISRRVLRGGVGAPPRPRNLLGHYGYSCLWPEVGAVVFLDRLGGIWHTEGTELARLDYYGPRKPRVAVTGDHVAALGSNLFCARDGRLLLFRYLGAAGEAQGTGSWTELVPPVPGQVKSMAPLEDCMYFIAADGTLWRFALGLDAERGLANGQPLELVVETPTVAAPDGHKKALWFRFGMRVGDIAGGFVKQVTVRSGPALSDGSPSGPALTTTLDRALADRADFVVPAHGASGEASATVTLTGDVVLESATFWISGYREKR